MNFVSMVWRFSGMFEAYADRLTSTPSNMAHLGGGSRSKQAPPHYGDLLAGAPKMTKEHQSL
jgi:hypothetical protein